MNNKQKDEIINAMISLDAPDIAYSIHKIPHNPKDYNSLNKKQKTKVRTSRNQFQEFLFVCSDSDESQKKLYLNHNADVKDFIDKYKITDEILKKASKECASHQQIVDIGLEAVEALEKCAGAIKEAFGEIENEDFLKKISFELKRPDIGYALFRTGLGPWTEFKDKETKRVFAFAVFEFLSYVDCLKEALAEDKVIILKDYLNKHSVLGEFFKKYHNELKKFFVPKEKK